MDKTYRGENIMSATTRFNGSFGNYSTGTLRTVAQLKAFVIDAGADLQDQDADAAGEVDQAVEMVIREVQPLMYSTPTAGDGIIHVIVDGHAVDAAGLQARIRALDNGSGYRLNAATVTLGTSIVVA
jgi:hypothetical protein